MKKKLEGAYQVGTSSPFHAAPNPLQHKNKKKNIKLIVISKYKTET